VLVGYLVTIAAVAGIFLGTVPVLMLICGGANRENLTSLASFAAGRAGDGTRPRPDHTPVSYLVWRRAVHSSAAGLSQPTGSAWFEVLE